jgi:hypothetical protein
LEDTLLPATDHEVLELDEVWSFVGNGKNQSDRLKLYFRIKRWVTQAWYSSDFENDNVLRV